MSIPTTNTTQPTPYWRLMQLDDIDTVFDVSIQVHAELPEDKEIFIERQTLFNQGCLVLISEDQIVGYTLSHPIRPDSPPSLNTLLNEINEEAVDYYIHDVALLPKMRGSGMARVVIEKLLSVASDYNKTILISVYGTGSFWERFGFVKDERDLTAKLEPYGETAIMMYHAPVPPQ